jgi:hypothetical protein
MKNECAEEGILFFLKTGHTGYLKIEDFMPIKKCKHALVTKEVLKKGYKTKFCQCPKFCFF